MSTTPPKDPYLSHIMETPLVKKPILTPLQKEHNRPIYVVKYTSDGRTDVSTFDDKDDAEDVYIDWLSQDELKEGEAITLYKTKIINQAGYGWSGNLAHSRLLKSS